MTDEQRAREDLWQRYVDANEARIDAEARIAELEEALRDTRDQDK